MGNRERNIEREDNRRLFYSAVASVTLMSTAVAGLFYKDQIQKVLDEQWEEISRQIAKPQPQKETAPQVCSPDPSASKDIQPKVPELTREQIADRVKKALVFVEFKDKSGVGGCTGFVLEPTTFVTARHCPGMNNSKHKIDRPHLGNLHFYPWDTDLLKRFNSSYKGNVTYKFYESANGFWNPDLAYVSLDEEVFAGRQALKIAPVFSANDKFYTFHFTGETNFYQPVGKWHWQLDEGTFTELVNIIEEDGTISTVVNMQMPNIRKGNSGGPVVNGSGEVVGVLSSYLEAKGKRKTPPMEVQFSPITKMEK